MVAHSPWKGIKAMKSDTNTILRLAGVALVMLLPACGGGGGGNPASPGPKAVLTIASSGTPSAPMAGVGVTVVLPAGVTPPLNPDGSAAGSTVETSGVVDGGVALAPVYTPATSTVKGTLRFAMASSQPAGFGAGEFAKMTLNTSSGALPVPGDFSLTGFAPISLGGSPVTGLTAGFTLELQ